MPRYFLAHEWRMVRMSVKWKTNESHIIFKSIVKMPNLYCDWMRRNKIYFLCMLYGRYMHHDLKNLNIYVHYCQYIKCFHLKRKDLGSHKTKTGTNIKSNPYLFLHTEGTEGGGVRERESERQRKFSKLTNEFAGKFQNQIRLLSIFSYRIQSARNQIDEYIVSW